MIRVLWCIIISIAMKVKNIVAQKKNMILCRKGVVLADKT